MNAPLDVLAVLDRAHAAFSGPQAAEIYAAREAIVHLMAAAESAIMTHARVNTATVAGRRELGPRVRHLRAMLEKAGRRVEGVR